MADQRTPQLTPIPLDFVKAFLIRGRRPILVDAGLAADPASILDEVHRQGIDPRGVSLIVVTHAHTDHVGGLAALKRVTGAPVAVHASEAECLREGRSAEVRPLTAEGHQLAAAGARPGPKPVEPDILVGTVLDLAPFGVDGSVIHTPGHTHGSLTVLLGKEAAIVGDLVAGRPAGQACLPPFGLDLGQLKASIAKVAALSPATVYPSHGEPFAGSELRRLAD